MPLNYLGPRLFLLAVLSCLEARADAVEEPGEKLMGRCFANEREAVQATFGASALNGESIEIKPVLGLTDGNLWMMDDSAGHNPAWFLLQPNEERQLCLTLFIPAACCVEMKQRGQTLTATVSTQPSPGYPQKRAVYHRRKGERVFSFDAKSCLKITRKANGKTSRQSMPCSNRFYYDEDDK